MVCSQPNDQSVDTRKYKWLLLLSVAAVTISVLLFFATRAACGNIPASVPVITDTVPPPVRDYASFYVVTREVKVKDYFKFMDTLVRRLDSEVSFDLNEYILLRTNPRLLDSLMGTDYYLRKARGEFVYNQKQLAVLHKGDTIFIPGDSLAARVRRQMEATWLDINIPEFRLRIVEGSDTLHTLPVRVGQNRQRFLETIGRDEILRTKTGTGKIIRVNKYPVWTNPVDGEEYKDTKRDDGLRTKMPQIPWLEPEINGARYGQMIHPTTNPETLNKAYSNGCIGASEADSWLIYAMAPIGTKVVIRYDRMKITAQGDTVWLRHVYDKNKMKKE